MRGAGECSAVRPFVTTIVNHGFVPLIQGAIKYAWFDGVDDRSFKVKARARQTDPTQRCMHTPCTLHSAHWRLLIPSCAPCVVQAEAAAFSAAVLPHLAHCSAEDAAIVDANLKIGAFETDFGAVHGHAHSALVSPHRAASLGALPDSVHRV